MPTKALLGLIARFVFVFSALAAFWWWVAPAYDALVFPVANAVLGMDDPVTAQLAGDTEQWVAVAVDGQTKTPIFEFDRFGTFFNVVLLLSLLLISPIRGGWGRWPRLGAGGLMLWAIHVGFIVVQVKAQFINLGLIFVTPQSAYLYNWVAVFMGTLGQQLLPLTVVAGLSWRAWIDWFQSQSQDQAKKYVAPCTCGSGKKYKHCCGKSKVSSFSLSHH